MSGNRELKAALRKDRLALRDAIVPDDRERLSARLCGHGAKAIAFQPGTVISGFFPIRSEADIRPLMAQLRAAGARLCLPVVLDRETIVFRDFQADLPIVDTGFGTSGPGPDAALLDPDILLVPLSAFDNRGSRIGYGAGHYDRAIECLLKKGGKPRVIGIAFDCQEVASVPAETHDVGLDAVLTESGLRSFA